MSQSSKKIVLQGNLTVDRAAAIAKELSSALATVDTVSLDFSKAESLDLSFIQVLYAAETEAVGLGKSLVFTGTLCEDIRDTLTVGGFCREAPLNAQDLVTALFDYRELSATSAG